jgi:Protein of unknown function (DUF3800)
VLVLIDESGDCGLKFGKGSSDYFTCVAVVFSDEFSMSACDRTIDGLKMEINKPSSFEFHFAPTSDKIRRLFLKTSHSNNLLQLADMTCGAVMRSYNSSDSSFRDLVKKREKFVQLWPKASVY